MHVTDYKCNKTVALHQGLLSSAVEHFTSNEEVSRSSRLGGIPFCIFFWVGDNVVFEWFLGFPVQSYLAARMHRAACPMSWKRVPELVCKKLAELQRPEGISAGTICCCDLRGPTDPHASFRVLRFWRCLISYFRNLSNEASKRSEGEGPLSDRFFTLLYQGAHGKGCTRQGVFGDCISNATSSFCLAVSAAQNTFSVRVPGFLCLSFASSPSSSSSSSPSPVHSLSSFQSQTCRSAILPNLPPPRRRWSHRNAPGQRC